MKIYTKAGDRGTTSLVGGCRVPKHDMRVEAYGTVDELNSWMGYILSITPVCPTDTRNFLTGVQRHLFDLGTILATPIEKSDKIIRETENLREAITVLELEIDRLDGCLPTLSNFILPGGTPAASATHIARTVCRRAERLIDRCVSDKILCEPEVTATYANRLSDYLFTLARYFNHIAKVADVSL